jgi:excisionase family DNA binding protein
MAHADPNPSESTGKLLVSLSEAARLLSLSERMVWQLKRSGALPSVRLGRALRFHVGDLNDLIASHRSGPVSEAVAAGGDS